MAGHGKVCVYADRGDCVRLSSRHTRFSRLVVGQKTEHTIWYRIDKGSPSKLFHVLFRNRLFRGNRIQMPLLLTSVTG